MAKQENKTVAQNKKAYHDYFVLETYEAGIELFGTEIKSIRAGKLNLKDSWCNVVNGEMLANGVHISPYEMGNRFNRDPLRPKRLLIPVMIPGLVSGSITRVKVCHLLAPRSSAA